MTDRKTRAHAAPWDKDNPKPPGRHKHLDPKAKASARRRAKAAGRPYPNLVDNMRAAADGVTRADKPKRTPSAAAKKSPDTKAATKRTATRKTAAGKSSRSKSPAKKTEARATSPRRGASKESSAKDPQGGLTAAGRTEFARKQGAHLKPGVMKPESEMSLQEMRRKGSWATRFYGRATLPPLLKPDGEPTRFALSAHAWGEKVPKTEAAARRIAEKGRKLLARYRRERDAAR